MRILKHVDWPLHSIVLTLGLVMTAAHGAIPHPSTKKSSQQKLIQHAAQAFMQQYHIAGLTIGITQHGHHQVYSYGVMSRQTQQPVNADTLFEIGSISKIFNVTLASQAQQQGKLSLHKQPSVYIPMLKGSVLDQVSLLNLATHTAGGFPLQLPDDVHTDDQLMDYFVHWQPKYAANAQRQYANPSIGLLGLITAKQFQQPYAEALKQQVLLPLGMTSTDINVPAKNANRYAQGYKKDQTPVRLNPAPLADEAYGVKSSANDLLRFIDANLGLLKINPALQQAIDNTHIGYFDVPTAGDALAGTPIDTPSAHMTQALIWEQYAYPVTLNTLLAGHSSHMVYDSVPVTRLTPPQPPQQQVWINKTGATNGFGAYIAFIPSEQLGIVILANTNHPTDARVRLADHMMQSMLATPNIKP